MLSAIILGRVNGRTAMQILGKPTGHRGKYGQKKLARAAFNKLKPFLKDIKLELSIKVRIFDSLLSNI